MASEIKIDRLFLEEEEEIDDITISLSKDVYDFCVEKGLSFMDHKIIIDEEKSYIDINVTFRVTNKYRNNE